MDSAYTDNVAIRYGDFARNEIRDRDPVYRRWSEGVAEDSVICDLISTLPPMDRQPVLVFAAARHCGASDSADYSSFRDFLLTHWDQIAATTRERFTQTNEAKRCAVLLPFLSLLSGPLALVEVGASAGLCLYPDQYSYRYTVEGLAEPVILGTGGPVLDCELRGGIPAPRHLPEVVHRGGVDLHPLDAADADSRAWLRSLVWPGHDERLLRLDAALDIAAADPPGILAGDLVDRVAEAVAACPAGSTPVVFHTAVLAYLSPERRAEFVATVQSLDCIWISVEGVGILPQVEAQLPSELRAHRGLFVVSVGGQALATAQGHGEWARAL